MTPTGRSALALALGVSLLAVGCSVRVADLTLISTKNIDLSQTKLDMREGKRFKGEDCRFLALPNLEEAIDDALEKGGGNIMVDQVTYQKPGFFMSCIEVEGTVLNSQARQ
jgi:hypothetical protein